VAISDLPALTAVRQAAKAGIASPAVRNDILCYFYIALLRFDF